jgi:hypothetical protein
MEEREWCYPFLLSQAPYKEERGIYTNLASVTATFIKDSSADHIASDDGINRTVTFQALLVVDGVNGDILKFTGRYSSLL